VADGGRFVWASSRFGAAVTLGMREVFVGAGIEGRATSRAVVRR